MQKFHRKAMARQFGRQFERWRTATLRSRGQVGKAVGLNAEVVRKLECGYEIDASDFLALVNWATEGAMMTCLVDAVDETLK